MALKPPKAINRKRSLTIPSAGNEPLDKSQKTHSQSQSPLFQLPREIRDLIWQEYILSETSNHNNCVLLKWDLDSPPSVRYYQRVPEFDKPGHMRGFGSDQRGVQITALLRTCRDLITHSRFVSGATMLQVRYFYSETAWAALLGPSSSSCSPLQQPTALVPS